MARFSLALWLSLLASPLARANAPNGSVRICEVPNETIRDAVRFELIARQEVVEACDTSAQVTLRIVFEDPLRGGFVEVRSGARVLQTRLSGPLDTLDDRAVAVTAAALVEAVRSPMNPPDSEVAAEPAEEAAVEDDTPLGDEDELLDAQAPLEEGAPLEEDTPLEEEALAEGEISRPYITYLDARHVVTIAVGAQNVGRNAVVAGAIGYGAMPSANIRVGTQLGFGLGNAYAVRLDLRATYVWHHGAWTTELGVQVLGALRVFDLEVGFETGGGLGLHGGATWYATEHFGFHFAAEVAGLYTRLSDAGDSGGAIELAAFVGVRFGP